MGMPYLLYTLYREAQTIGRVNKEPVCQSTKRPYEGKSWVSVKPMKVTELFTTIYWSENVDVIDALDDQRWASKGNFRLSNERYLTVGKNELSPIR